MAKQSFSVGQVLTAAQMTSLQQTAMLGGAASAKTANYTLVAADAGTGISMSSTSATTVTVNTGLFAAGDTVQITNLNTGVCTITAGTATVNTSASLALAQYESGTLYFTSASASIFIKGAGASAASGGMTLLNSGGTALSGSSVTISSLSTSYKNLFIVWNKAYSSTNTSWGVRYNSDTGTNYYNGTLQYNTYEFNAYPNNDYNILGSLSTNTSDKEACNGYAEILRYADGDSKFIYSNQQFKYGASLMFPQTTWCNYDSSTAISELTFRVFSGTFSGGTVYIYGVN